MRSAAAHRILFIQYNNSGAFPPLEHSSNILAERGWTVAVRGVDLEGGAGKLRLKLRQGMTYTAMKPYRRGLRQKLHYARFLFWCVGSAIRFRPSWVYLSDPIAAPVGLAVRRVLRVRLLYHEHDGLTETTRRPVDRMLANARLRVLREADVVVFPSVGRKELTVASTGEGSLARVVWNCPRKQDAALARPPRSSGDFRLVYHGSLVPPRLPTALLDAMCALPALTTLALYGYETIGHPGFLGYFMNEASLRGLGRRIACGGPLNRDQLYDECRKGSLGVCLFSKHTKNANEETMAGASNKVFDYLACGLPALVPNDPSWNEMIVVPGFGLSCDSDDPAAIARAINWLVENPNRAAEMGEAGRQRILSDWNYETVFTPVLHDLEGAMVGAP